MSDRIPLVVFGDAPNRPTGLSRIATDLTARLAVAYGDRLDVRQVGWAQWAGLPVEGIAQTGWHGEVGDENRMEWPAWVYGAFDSRGVQALHTAYRTWFGDQRGIVLSVWDAGRIEVTRNHALPVDFWAYVPVDAENIHGAIAGPAKWYLEAASRVLAYGPYGKGVLEKTLRQHVGWAAHGIDPEVFHPIGPLPSTDTARVREILGALADRKGQTTLVGCVATNQRRKDLGVFAQVLRQLIDADPNVHGWLHTHTLVSDAWSVPQLVEDFGLQRHLGITTSLPDEDLAAMYRACSLTIAPGRGEGFGYPIAESMACGTPVIHLDYAGGADLVPRTWRVTPQAYQLEGPYAERRPVWDVARTVGLATSLLADAEDTFDPTQLAHKYLWPHVWSTQWTPWIDAGLAAWR